MIKRFLIYCMLALMAGSVAAAEVRSIAITIDDAPRPDASYFDGPTRTSKLIETLARAKVGQVMGKASTYGIACGASCGSGTTVQLT